MGAKKEEVKKVTKKTKKEEVVEKGKLEVAVDLLNESGLLEEELVFDGEDEESTIEQFMQAVESISGEKEDDIPEEVVNTYNEYVDAAEAKEKEEKEVKKAKGGKKEKVEKPVKKEKEKPAKKEAGEKDPDKVARGKALAASRMQNKGPSNLDVMKELLGKKASDKEIYKVFEKRYEGKEKAFVEKRIGIYKNLAK